MQIAAQIIFALILLFAIGLFWRNMKKLNRNIRLGRKNWPNNNPGERWKKVVLNALGQKKMFKRPIPATLHFFVYAGFIIINIEILEIILDGIFGTHRLFNPILGNFYAGFINIFEFLALAVLISCVIFLIRRNILKVKRLDMPELNRWPRMDANIILITEVVLMTAFLMMNGADQVLQSRGSEHYHQTGSLFFSSFLMPLFNGMSDTSLMAIERGGWWFHILGVFAFLNYLPFSKHLHIILSFPNTYYARTEPQGKMYNMPEIQREVALMLDPNAAVDIPADASAEPGRFGAKDVYDLQTTDILGAYSCTECGRCTASCPANITGKKLSPRKIMMDTRDRAEEIGRGIDKNGTDFKDEKSLFGDYITAEEILACTSCQACVEACPVNIDPLTIINQLKRYMIMEEAKSPNSWNVMFGNIENNQAPWQFSPSDRFKWADELKE
ncbi:MAG: 4Fe-4S dicluster domain-containing protein [Sphingobacteriales bacterium]|nr:MAG: 4Fe-4S dicluster domain-containing protein [Sphingobacteriales bacterium]